MNKKLFLELLIPNYQSKIHLLKIEGTEWLSEPFYFHLTVFPDSFTEFKNLQLAQPISLAIHHADNQPPQWFNGIIQTLQYSETQAELTVVPQLTLLQDKLKSRGFTKQTVIDILKQLCREHGLTNVDFSELTGSYPELPYCVQYQETDFDFLMRICAEHGIYYYFRQSKDKHELLFSDAPLPQLYYPEKLLHRNVQDSNMRPHLYHWTRTRESVTSITKSRSFSLITPNCAYQAENQNNQSQPAIPIANRTHLKHDEGGYLTGSAELAARLKIQQQAQNLQKQRIQCEGNYPNLSAGTQINIVSEVDPQINGAYYLYEVKHYAAEQTVNTYHNQLSLYPQSINFVPLHADISKEIPGITPALVSGDSQDDANSNIHASVKVRPEWAINYNDNDNADHTNSCWARVKQNVAGNGFGSQFIPRVNQEVIMSFQQGQTHKLSVIGGLYKNKYLPIYNSQTQSGFKTHSLGGEKDQGHNLRFDDTPQQEEIFLKSQKDKRVLVNGEHCRTVQNNSKKKLEYGDYQMTVRDEFVITAKQKLHLHVGTSEIIVDASGVNFHADTIVLDAEN